MEIRFFLILVVPYVVWISTVTVMIIDMSHSHPSCGCFSAAKEKTHKLVADHGEMLTQQQSEAFWITSTNKFPGADICWTAFPKHNCYIRFTYFQTTYTGNREEMNMITSSSFSPVTVFRGRMENNNNNNNDNNFSTMPSIEELMAQAEARMEDGTCRM